VSFTIVQVRGGPFTLPDRDVPDVPIPAQGQVEFELENEIRDTLTNEIIEPTTTTVNLDSNGSFYVFLPASDDVDPAPTAYKVTVKVIGSKPHTRRIEIPAAAAPAGIDLADITDATETPVFTYVLLSTFETHVNGTAADNVHPGYLTDLPAGDNVWHSKQHFESGVPVADVEAQASYDPTPGADNSAAIREAIAKVDAIGGGRVRMGVGVFWVSQEPTKAWCIYLPSNVTLEGAAMGATTLRQLDTPALFTRLLTSTDEKNIIVRNLTLDGNKAAQSVASEQRHAYFVDGCTNVTIEGVEVIGPTGDGIYFHPSAATGPCVRPIVRGCKIHDVQRCGIHAQAVIDGHLVDTDIFDQPADNLIKAEQTGPSTAWLIDGLTIEGCGLRSSAFANNGVVLSGNDATHRVRRIRIVNCLFEGCNWGVGLGLYSDDWLISNCLFDGCHQAVSTTSYATARGFTQSNGVAISNIEILGADGVAGQPPIHLSGATGGSITGVLMRAFDPACKEAIRLSQCKGITVTGGQIEGTGTTGMAGVVIYRSQNCSVGGGIAFTMPTGTGVTLLDDATAPAANCSVGHIVVRGPATNGINCSGYGGATGATLSIPGPIVAPGVTNFVTGLTMAKQSRDWRARLPMVPTANLPAAGANQDGNVMLEDVGAGAPPNVIVYANGKRGRLTPVNF
jgi:hypothetical protein